MQQCGVQGGLLQVVKAGRGALRVGEDGEGDVGLHSRSSIAVRATTLRCMFGRQLWPAPVCVGTAKTLTCHTSHEGGKVTRGTPCQVESFCWRMCSIPHLAGAAGHGKAAVVAVAPLDLVDEVVDGAAG